MDVVLCPQEEEAPMQPFNKRYLSIRDGNLSPRNSWKRRVELWRRYGGIPESYIAEECHFSLVTRLESLTREDLEFALLAGAASDALHLIVNIRFDMEPDESSELVERLHAQFIAPYAEVGCECVFYMMHTEVAGCGLLAFTLFPTSAIPLEERKHRLVSKEAFRELLYEIGSQQIESVPQTLN
jgi:hypothetical protein